MSVLVMLDRQPVVLAVMNMKHPGVALTLLEVEFPDQDLDHGKPSPSPNPNPNPNPKPDLFLDFNDSKSNCGGVWSSGDVVRWRRRPPCDTLVQHKHTHAHVHEYMQRAIPKTTFSFCLNLSQYPTLFLHTRIRTRTRGQRVQNFLSKANNTRRSHTLSLLIFTNSMHAHACARI